MRRRCLDGGNRGRPAWAPIIGAWQSPELGRLPGPNRPYGPLKPAEAPAWPQLDRMPVRRISGGLMQHSRGNLSNLLTISEPLGPISHERIVDEFVDELVDDDVTAFKEVNQKPYTLLLGRKGAGKSALITDLRLQMQRRNDGKTSLGGGRHQRRQDFVISVLTWQHFNKIVLSVGRKFSVDEVLGEIIPVEHFIELWYEMLWDEIIQHFYNLAHYEDSRVLLAPVDAYVNAAGPFEGNPRDEARRSFEASRRAVLAYLESRGVNLYFLFDSMDNYPVRKPTFSKIFTGLFQALTRVSDDSPRIHVTFCVPEEVEDFMTASSTNLMKDFASSFRIKWKPIDLLRVVAHRLRLSARLHDPALYAMSSEFDFAQREHIHQFFDAVLPAEITNGQGTQENTLAYIIRHTQLLPRHIIDIFNRTISSHYRQAKSFTGVSQEAVREGVRDSQRLISAQILHPYEQLYPKLLSACRSILPDLDPICSFAVLRKNQGRFQRKIEDDIGSVWDTLFRMGVLGRSIAQTGAHAHHVDMNDRYCYGQFHFNIEGAFGLATDGEYCFHPVFSRAFGMVRRTDDKRVVYPAHIDLFNVYGEQA
ncbi:P-loop ATPase, Sll1717 family [Roseateles violae]|uniref:Uncharacterized protein n=1 Tax=Roseateles violae TaxID=3058042 RepID=A0ABT8DPN2_9BURK|nr:hypothetical protein [Pelomonas sp. PFR6]MDN3920122.1 hypothetical protein [Pelomonas sp. PFR6]